MIYELTPDAIELGLAAALPAVFELSCTSFVMINRTPRESLPATARTA